MKVYYLVYKLTNLVNGKIYVGCHMTKDVNDGYMGSGRRINYAKKKYGIENFKKEILKICETTDEMLAEEKLIVDEEFLKRSDVYNLACGGRGSWFYVNQTLTVEQRSKIAKAGNAGYAEKLKDPVAFERHSKLSSSVMKETHAAGKIRYDTFTGRRHSEESKRKISASRKKYFLSVGKPG